MTVQFFTPSHGLDLPYLERTVLTAGGHIPTVCRPAETLDRPDVRVQVFECGTILTIIQS